MEFSNSVWQASCLVKPCLVDVSSCVVMCRKMICCPLCCREGGFLPYCTIVMTYTMQWEKTECVESCCTTPRAPTFQIVSCNKLEGHVYREGSSHKVVAPRILRKVAMRYTVVADRIKQTIILKTASSRGCHQYFSTRSKHDIICSQIRCWVSP